MNKKLCSFLLMGMLVSSSFTSLPVFAENTTVNEQVEYQNFLADDSFKDFYDFLETRFEYLKFKNTGRNKGFKTVIFSITVDVNQSYFKKYCKSINDAVSQME